MDGFLTNSITPEPEIKDAPELKTKPTIKIKEPKAPRKTNAFRALLIGLLLLALLVGAFVAYDKYQKGELKLDNLNLPFLIKKDTNNNLPITTQNDTNRSVTIPDINSDLNS